MKPFGLVHPDKGDISDDFVQAKVHIIELD